MTGKELVADLRVAWAEDRLTDSAAALVFYGVLALFPFLLFLFAVASLVLDPGSVQSITSQLTQVAPPAAAQLVGEQLQSLAARPRPGLLTVGVLGALWSASGGLVALQRVLNVIYDAKENRPFWKKRGIALAMTIVTAVLALAAMLVAVALPAVAKHLGGPLATVAVWARLPVAGLVMMVLWAVLYYALPAVRQKFKLLSVGAVVAVVVWVVASWAFSLYVSHFGTFDATYGAIGGVIVLLLWMWISATALLLGAEINAAVEHAAGTVSREPPPPSRRLEDRPSPPPVRPRGPGERPVIH